MDVGLPSLEIPTQGVYCLQLLLCDGIKVNEARRRRRFPALCGTSLHPSTTSLEISEHLQEQR